MSAGLAENNKDLFRTWGYQGDKWGIYHLRINRYGTGLYGKTSTILAFQIGTSKAFIQMQYCIT
jgi:hypothetical protein